MAFQPLGKKRYSELVSQEIETKILNKELSLWEKFLSEVDLAKEFQVKRGQDLTWCITSLTFLCNLLSSLSLADNL